MHRNEPDLEAMIRALVADEVRVALEPFQASLQRLTQFLAPGRDTPQRTATAASDRVEPALNRPARKLVSSRASARRTPEPVRAKATLRPGQRVRFSEAGKEHEAVIEAVEPESGTLLLVQDDGSEAVCTIDQVTVVARKAESHRAQPNEIVSKVESVAINQAPANDGTPQPGDDVVFQIAESTFDGIVLEVDAANAIVLVERKDDGRSAWRPLASVQPRA